MIDFVGAGPGAVDLITLRGAKLLEQADVVIYAGSLVNKELLDLCRDGCEIYDSAVMVLEEVISLMRRAHERGQRLVRLHTGDPSLYGAIREQLDQLDKLSIPYRITPGVSSFCAAAAALNAEFTLPGVSQSLILTRKAGRTQVPERERLENISSLGTSLCLFLSAGMAGDLQRDLLQGGYLPETPAAIVYKASWPDERIIRCNVASLEEACRENDITKTALILVGDFLKQLSPDGEAGAAELYERSRLYSPDFSTGFRKALQEP